MTAGFYKYKIGEPKDQLLYAPNAVHNKNYKLLKEEKDNYQYPVSGWYWFDTEEEAFTFFNIEVEE